MNNGQTINMWVKIGLAVGIILLVVMGGIVDAAAQSIPGPPAFPSTPSKAPIDGGLGLLAAAGGAYAWKKLKADKK